MNAYALFDVGGTKTRIALTSDCVSFAEPIVFKTPRTYEEGIARIIESVQSLASTEALHGVAGGIRGRLAPDHSMMLHDRVLPDWQEKPLAEDLRHELGVPVFLENDAALAALGESHFGAGMGYDIVAYHTVSTGVGGARIDHGKIDAESLGFEPGKQIIDIDHTLCQECKSATLEDHISGASLEVRFGKKAYEIPQEDRVWDELAGWLAHGLVNTISYWSPEVIVLGGSMILGNPRIMLSTIKTHVAELMKEGASVPPILDAELGDLSGVYGAMALLSEKSQG